MNILIADISGVEAAHCSLIDVERAGRINRLRFADDKKRCIMSGLLIRRFFGNTDICRNEWGKPFAADGGHFNISHSGDYVLFAVSDSEVGCDIERVRFVDPLKTGRAVFTDKEKEYIINGADKIGAFFELWTKKESLLKCIGQGFHRSAKSVDVSGDIFEEDEKVYHMKCYRFADYTVSVCSEKDDFPKSVSFIDLKELVG